MNSIQLDYYDPIPVLTDECELLATRGKVSEVSVAHPRYIGHRLGVYNPQGEKVGTPGPARNREHLFVVECAAVKPLAAYEHPIELPQFRHL